MLFRLRLLLGFGCLFGLYMAIDGFLVTRESGETPKVYSLNDLVAQPGQELPRYIEIKDAHPSWFVCMKTKDSGSDRRPRPRRYHHRGLHGDEGASADRAAGR